MNIYSCILLVRTTAVQLLGCWYYLLPLLLLSLFITQKINSDNLQFNYAHNSLLNSFIVKKTMIGD